MKALYLCIGLILITLDTTAEMRTWTAAESGKTFVGELVSQNGSTVTLKSQSGKNIKVPIAGLSQADQDYIIFMRPINLAIALETKTKDVERQNRECCYFKINIRNRGLVPIAKRLDLYTFIFAENGDLQSCSYMPDIRISGSSTILSSLDAPVSYFNGEEYDHYLVLVADTTDHIVAFQSDNKILEKDSERQKQLLIEGKSRRLLPDLLAGEPSDSEQPAFTLRYIDTTTTIKTNAAGEAVSHIGNRLIDPLTSIADAFLGRYRIKGATYAYMPSHKVYTAFIKAYFDNGFSIDLEEDIKTYFDNRISIDLEEDFFQSTKRLSTVVLPFYSMNAIESLLLFAPAPESIPDQTPESLGWLRIMMEMLVQQPKSHIAPLPWLVHYQGFIEHDSDITFRFVRQGSSIGIVGIDGKVVLQNDQLSDRERKAAQIPDSIVFNEGAPQVYVGEWITLNKGKPRQLDIALAPPSDEDGLFSSILFVEVKDGSYMRNKKGGPILPLFCAGDAPGQELLDCIYAGVCPKGKTPAPVIFKIVSGK